MADSASTTYIAALLNRYVSAVGLTILVYDLVITSGEEIRLIWKAKLSVAKVLYLYNRYTVPAAFTFNACIMSGNVSYFSDEFCARFISGLGLYQLTETMGVIPVMLLLRVYALYNRNWRVLAGLLGLTCATFITSLTLLLYGMGTASEDIGFVPLTHDCSYLGMTQLMWAVFLILSLFSLCFESIVITLIVCRTWRQIKSPVRMPLSEALLRDGLAYYVVMISLLVMGLIESTVSPAEFEGTLAYLIWSMHSALISRIYLHLRDVASPTDWTISTGIRQQTRPHRPMPARPSQPDLLDASHSQSRGPSRGPSRRGHLRLLSDVTEIEDFVVEITHRPIDYYDDWAHDMDGSYDEKVSRPDDERLSAIQEVPEIDDAEIGIAL